MVRKVHTEWLWGVNVAHRSDMHGNLRAAFGPLAGTPEGCYGLSGQITKPQGTYSIRGRPSSSGQGVLVPQHSPERHGRLRPFSTLKGQIQVELQEASDRRPPPRALLEECILHIMRDTLLHFSGRAYRQITSTAVDGSTSISVVETCVQRVRVGRAQRTARPHNPSTTPQPLYLLQIQQ